MLRLTALLLLLANGLYLVWSQGWLLPYGLGPAQQSEPQHLAQQIAPEALHLLSRQEFKGIEADLQAERAPKDCLQAGPIDAAQVGNLRQTLGEVLPPDSWQLVEVQTPARWIIYSGKYSNPDNMAKKRADLAASGIKTETLPIPALEPGFSLGGFDSREAADAALVRLSPRGLHSARVVQEREDSVSYLLRLPAVGAALKPRLADVRSALAGQALHSCN